MKDKKDITLIYVVCYDSIRNVLFSTYNLKLEHLIQIKHKLTKHNCVKYYRHSNMKVPPGRGTVQHGPRPGDVCYVEGSANSDPVLVKVTEVNSDHVCTVTTGHRHFTIPTNKLLLLHTPLVQLDSLTPDE